MLIFSSYFAMKTKVMHTHFMRLAEGLQTSTHNMFSNRNKNNINMNTPFICNYGNNPSFAILTENSDFIKTAFMN